ncbi:hypothetical protein GQR58_028677 [Nymphon striatum]|nr:hypothetical protein GQR58_028677 [Nymphon striatum]
MASEFSRSGSENSSLIGSSSRSRYMLLFHDDFAVYVKKVPEVTVNADCKAMRVTNIVILLSNPVLKDGILQEIVYNSGSEIVSSDVELFLFNNTVILSYDKYSCFDYTQKRAKCMLYLLSSSNSKLHSMDMNSNSVANQRHMIVSPHAYAWVLVFVGGKIYILKEAHKGWHCRPLRWTLVIGLSQFFSLLYLLFAGFLFWPMALANVCKLVFAHSALLGMPQLAEGGARRVALQTTEMDLGNRS